MSEGWILSSDGDLGPTSVSDDLAGTEVTEVLAAYVRRAARGMEDDALVIGTSKDLVEATAAHVLVQLWGSYPSKSSFEMADSTSQRNRAASFSDGFMNPSVLRGRLLRLAAIPARSSASKAERSTPLGMY
jgi:hypothetical protein